MDALNFETGKRRYCINDDPNRVIEFAVGDYNILPRVQECQKRLAADDRLKAPAADDMAALAAYISESDRIIREAVDEVFDAPVSAVAFGGTHPATRLKSGKLLYEAFLDAMADEVRKAINELAEEPQRVAKYTDKYTQK